MLLRATSGSWSRKLGGQPMPDRTPQSRVRDFADALALAAYDRRLELSGRRIIYYYDNDVVLGMVLGFEDQARRTDRESLIRSLLARHFLGTAFMLGPHQLELKSNIRRQPTYSSVADTRVFKHQAELFLRDQGIEAIMASLYAVVKSSQEDDDRLENFLDILRPNAGRIFSAIERINGSWTKRLRRMWDEGVISLDRPGPSMSEIMETHWGTIYSAIQLLKLTRGSGRPHDFSNLNDAASIAIMRSMAEATDNGQADEVIRFYSESSWRSNEDIGSLLSYKKPLLDSLPHTKGADRVLCDSSYLLMRVRFPELRVGPVAGDLNEIDKLLKQCEDVLKLDEREFDAAIKNITLRGEDLPKIINDLEDLRLMDSVLVRGESSSGLDKNFGDLSQWPVVFGFIKGEDTSDKVFAKIEDIQEELEAKLSLISSWTRDLEWLLKAAGVTRGKIKGSLEDPMRDLGLVRWGYNLSAGEKTTLVEVIKAALSEDQQNVSIACMQLATRLEQAKSDLRQCAFMCAVLWALGRFAEIVLLVEGWTGKMDIPPSLTVVKEAARFKAGIVKSGDEKRLILDGLWKLQASDTEGGLLLGIGYVFYHAWKQERLGSRILGEAAVKVDDEVQKWAEKSFEAGEKASLALPKNELAWAFAVNHCTYVGTVTRVESEKTSRFFKELLQVMDYPASRNFRFEDTLGVYFLVGAEEAWDRATAEERTSLQLEKDIELAEGYFSQAEQNDFGDIDTEEHRARVIEMKNKLRDAKRV